LAQGTVYAWEHAWLAGFAMIGLKCCAPSVVGGTVKLEPRTEPIVLTWNVCVNKENFDAVGLSLMPQDNVLRIDKVDPDGAAAEFNRTNEGKALQVGDFITSVNGVKGFAATMLEEVHQSSELLRLALARSEEFDVTVFRDGSLGGTFGVFLKTVVVKAIQAGPLEDWNKVNKDYTIQPGDLLVEINGVKNDGLKMLQELRTDGELQIKVRPLGGVAGH